MKKRRGVTIMDVARASGVSCAMDATRECGLRIPDDIPIIGFDDIPQASLVYLKLTTVRQPPEQMGRVAVKMLLKQIEDRSRPPQRVTLATQLVIRDSCGLYHTKSEPRKNVEKDRRLPITYK